ncbi:MAG: phosphoribosylanthranilate isomerase [Lachnospiraceae bacterium]|nr:phosphoribosylanthranilate isomerase [Lachnospiraceae bacterium]
MTKIKLCGLSRPGDIRAANELMPDYIGFVFAPKSRRYVSLEKAAELKQMLDPQIRAAGVFADEDPQVIEELVSRGVIDVVQLHGREDEAYIRNLRKRLGSPLIIQAFSIRTEQDAERADTSIADLILADSPGGGTGEVFDWELIGKIRRPYFLAGGLTPENVAAAVNALRPYGVDVSSGIETDGYKDKEKMKEFILAASRADE